MAGASTGGGRNHNFKVVLLGEGCVGKTSLVLRYVENKFNDKHITTLQASFLNKRINIGGKRVNIAIWDTAGQERFHALGPIYYRDSNGAILVYDITDEDSFQKVKNWVKELKKMLGNDICLCIAGNKIDMEKERHVSVEEAEAYAASVGAKHFHTSAKLNKGIDELFLDLSKKTDTTSAYCVSLELQKGDFTDITCPNRDWTLTSVLWLEHLNITGMLERSADDILSSGNKNRSSNRKSVIVVDDAQPTQSSGGGCC